MEYGPHLSGGRPTRISFALALLLAFVLFYGCHAFDPEPVGRNRPPDTKILDIEVEPTGVSPVLHHVYWSGTDDDGQVVRFVFAITDSLVDGSGAPDEDELDRLFDPADDRSTLEPTDWRDVGYTTNTDSVFLFELDPESGPDRGVTFHLVAADNHGAMDPSPARVHFFGNSLGRPVLKFTVSTYEDLGGGSMDWVTRWIGTPQGPAIGESPELSALPMLGFARRFRIDWEASSPNGKIVGYRFRPEARDPAYVPTDVDGEKQWDPSLRGFEYANNVPPTDLTGCDIDPTTGRLLETAICPAAGVRWPSDDYLLTVQALDIAQLESSAEDGMLSFQVNYAPETEIVDDGTWPLYRISDGHGGTDEFPITPPDTVPAGSQVVFNITGYDKTVDLVAPASHGELCCDTILETADVKFQAKYSAVLDNERFSTSLSTVLSEPFDGNPATIEFDAGPFAYEFEAIARDEHMRPDETPAQYEFVAGLQPRILSTLPATGDELVLTALGYPEWPGSLPYARTETSRYWTGEDWVVDPSQCPPGTCTTADSGTLFQFLADFEGQGHPNEPETQIRAWQFRQISDNDPLNRITDGLETKDFSSWISKPSPGNQWQWDAGKREAIEIFVPYFFWAAPVAFEPTSILPTQRAQGKWLANRLGFATMSLRARTTASGDKWPVYNRVRPNPEEVIYISIEDAGRRSDFVDIRWSLWIGLDTDGDTQPDRLWPDFDFSDYGD